MKALKRMREQEREKESNWFDFKPAEMGTIRLVPNDKPWYELRFKDVDTDEVPDFYDCFGGTLETCKFECKKARLSEREEFAQEYLGEFNPVEEDCSDYKDGEMKYFKVSPDAGFKPGELKMFAAETKKPIVVSLQSDKAKSIMDADNKLQKNIGKPFVEKVIKDYPKQECCDDLFCDCDCGYDLFGDV